MHAANAPSSSARAAQPAQQAAARGQPSRHSTQQREDSAAQPAQQAAAHLNQDGAKAVGVHRPRQQLVGDQLQRHVGDWWGGQGGRQSRAEQGRAGQGRGGVGGCSRGGLGGSGQAAHDCRPLLCSRNAGNSERGTQAAAPAPAPEAAFPRCPADPPLRRSADSLQPQETVLMASRCSTRAMPKSHTCRRRQAGARLFECSVRRRKATACPRHSAAQRGRDQHSAAQQPQAAGAAAWQA